MLSFLKELLEKRIARDWNRRAGDQPGDQRGLMIGARVVDDGIVGDPVVLAQNRRAEHLMLLGKTGTGKSSLMDSLRDQDIAASRYFASADLHGEEQSFLLKTIALRERALRRDLSDRVIVIDPSDPEYSVGLNPLEGQDHADRYVQIAEFAQILKEKWHLDSFGARTDELLRNALYALGESNFTLIELGIFLVDGAFRSRCLALVTNEEVREYFVQRYDQMSDAMRRVMAEPVLNKVSLFISDRRFRHLLGQRRSTFSLVDALDRGCWIFLNLDKGRLGEQAVTFLSLFIAKIKHTFFARRSRQLYTLYCDEIQNLIAHGDALETMLAEIRKRGGSIVSANQYLAQCPAEVQAALLSVGSFGFFQLSGQDAQQIATMLDGGKSLAERLKNLPRRHLIVKTVHERWREAVVPIVKQPTADETDLYQRSRARWARRRTDIEAEIRSRREGGRGPSREALDAWE